jgi:hypothetical protein
MGHYSNAVKQNCLFCGEEYVNTESLLFEDCATGQNVESCWLQAQLITMTRICDSKGKAAAGHTMKAYWGSRGTAPLIPNLDTRCRLMVNFLLQALVLRANFIVLALSEANFRTVHPHSINSLCTNKKSRCST